MGKQSSFTRQNAYDVLCTISSASHRNSTLEVDLRRTRKNVSVLASRLQEAHLVIGILEEALFSLLPPVPTFSSPPLPPSPDVVMDPPALEEDPEPLPLAVLSSSPASSPLPLDPIFPVPPVPPRPNVVMNPPASREDPDPTPESTETLPPENHAPPNLPASPRPPKARTPPALPSPGRTSFPLSEWNFPRRTYRFLEDIPLVLTPPPVFISPPAASQQPLQPPDPAPAAEPPPVEPLACPPFDLTPPVDGDTVVVAATPPSPRLGNPPRLASTLDLDFLSFARSLGLSDRSLADPAYVDLVRDIYVIATSTPAGTSTTVDTPNSRPEPNPLPIDQGEARPQRKNRRSRRKRY